MNPFRQKVVELADRAKTLHDRERKDTLESVELVGELLRRNASGYLLLDSRALAKRIGLTPNQFWKRTQVARLLERFPEFHPLLAEGHTTVSKLSLIAPRITPANRKIFLEGIRGKSARQISRLASGIAFDGTSLMSKDKRLVDALTDRALQVARFRGRNLTADTLMKEALEAWLIEWDEAASTWKRARTGPS